MTRLFPPVVTRDDREVAVLLTLPVSYLKRLELVAHQLGTDTSDALQEFLRRFWEEFVNGPMLEGLAYYSNLVGAFPELLRPIPEDAPGWVLDPITRKREYEPCCSRHYYLPALWYRQQVTALRKASREFPSADISDVLTLFFAWGLQEFRSYAQSRNVSR